VLVEVPSQELGLPEPVTPVFLEHSPDDRWLAGNGRGKLRIWGIDHGPIIRPYHDFDVDADTISFSPDGRFLLADAIDKTAFLSLDHLSQE
jgi:WD40 repeat protein